MFEIKGKFGTALCYAKLAENEAIEQIQRMCDYDFTAGSQIRIMPDVHAGAGCTIGTTMTVTDKLVPNIVGVDIGCGMYTVNLGKTDIDFALLDEAAHYIPYGMNVWEQKAEAFDLTALKCYSHLQDTERLECSLGTLGGGNHFIEADTAADGTKYLVIHSGSRNLGKQVAVFYQDMAIEQLSDKTEYLKKRTCLVNEYKAQGKTEEIQEALRAFADEYHKSHPNIPDDLCYLTGSRLTDYLHDVVICQSFAKRSREIMAEIILNKIGLPHISGFHTVHNYIDTQEMILRKGAIAAHSGELVLIPINMRDGSILARGKGNPNWNFSAPHGAGRIMSRAAAKENIDLEAFRHSMEGVYSTTVCADTLDEAPQAYKSIEDIIDVIHETVDVIEVLKPIFNFKALS